MWPRKPKRLDTPGLERSAQICKYLNTYQTSPPDFWFWKEGALMKLESGAAEIAEGLGELSSSLQTAMTFSFFKFIYLLFFLRHLVSKTFSIVSVTRKRVGEGITSPHCIRQIFSLFLRLREAEWLASNLPAGKLGFEPTSAWLKALHIHCSLLLLTISVMLEEHIFSFRAPGEAHNSPTLPSSSVPKFLGEVILPFKVPFKDLKQYIKTPNSTRHGGSHL